MKRHHGSRVASAIVAVGLLCIGAQMGAAQAQVTVFNRPPTPEELRQALLGGSAGAPVRAVPAAAGHGTVTGTNASSGAEAGGDARVDGGPDASGLAPGTRTRGIQWITPADAGPARGAAAASGSIGRPAPAARPEPRTEARAERGDTRFDARGDGRGDGRASAEGRSGVGYATPVVMSTAPATPAVVPTAAAAAADASGAASLPITFRSGSSRVDRSSLPYLESIALVMRGDERLALVIEGHTDVLGDRDRNRVLSWDRAVGVMRALVEEYGIDATRLRPVGKGAEEPLPGRPPEDGANRRVQFRVAGSNG